MATFVTPIGRLGFPTVFMKKAPKGSTKEAYSTQIVFDKPEELKPLREIMKQVAIDKWGPDRAKWPNDVRRLNFDTYLSYNGKDGFPIRDGNEVSYDGYKGKVFFSAKDSDTQPQVVDLNRQPVIDQAEVYGGRRARLVINVWAYDNSNAKGIGFSLTHVMIYPDDGIRFAGGGSRQSASEAYAGIDDSYDDPANYGATGTDEL